MRAQQVPHQIGTLRQSLFAGERMEQAFHVLKLPLPELSAYLTAQIEQNPLLEEIETYGMSLEEEVIKPLNFSEEDFSFVAPFSPYLSEDEFPPSQDEKVPAPDTLSHHLIVQAEEQLETEDECLAALFIIGSLEQDGLLLTPLEEIAVLSHLPLHLFRKILPILKTFDPPGVFCESVQEALLRKLRKNTLAYRLVEVAYPLLITKDIKTLKEEFGCTDETLEKAFHEIHRHRLGTEHCFEPASPPTRVPDLIIEGGTVKVENEGLPYFEIKEFPIHNDFSKAEKDYIRERQQEARWLIKNLETRKLTLQKIGEALLLMQKPFFSFDKEALLPLTHQMVAEKIGLHSSTVARAVKGKWLSCWRGIFPLESFFPKKMQTSESSSEAIKEEILRLIKHEDKKHPFSDAALMQKLKEAGLICSRRVITKYRELLGIPSSRQRR